MQKTDGAAGFCHNYAGQKRKMITKRWIIPAKNCKSSFFFESLKKKDSS